MMFDLAVLAALLFMGSIAFVVMIALTDVEVVNIPVQADLDQAVITFLHPVYDWAKEPYFAD